MMYAQFSLELRLNYAYIIFQIIDLVLNLISIYTATQTLDGDHIFHKLMEI